MCDTLCLSARLAGTGVIYSSCPGCNIYDPMYRYVRFIAPAVYPTLATLGIHTAVFGDATSSRNDEMFSSVTCMTGAHYSQKDPLLAPQNNMKLHHRWRTVLICQESLMHI